MTTASAVRAEEVEEFDRLVRTVSRVSRFALAFAIVEAPAQRDRLIRALAERLRTAGRSVATTCVDRDVVTVPIWSPLDVIAGTEPERRDHRRVLCVVDLDRALVDPARARATMDGLNRDRERFPRLINAPVVFWLSEAGLRLIASEAPDFWAWRSGVFTFPPARAAAGRRRDRASSDGARGALRPVPAATLWGTVTSVKPTSTQARALDAYLAGLIEKHQYLDFRGMGVADRVPLRLPLLEMYVPLSARAVLPEGETWARSSATAGRRRTAERADAIVERAADDRPVSELLQRWDALVVLGDPGAGKTTLLKYVALLCAAGRGDDVGLGARLPVFVSVGAYANALRGEDLSLTEFAARAVDAPGARPADRLLDHALAAGGVLLLLDGLDEVREGALRRRVAERVADLVTAYRGTGNKLLLSSRIVGYRGVRPAVEGLAECTLLDLTDEDVDAFVSRWTSALERAAQGGTAAAAEEAARERRELLGAIRDHPSVRALATNPLLLTILALMKRQGVHLPDRRVELYDQYVEVLLEHWNLARGRAYAQAPHLDVPGTVNVLAPLALWMHETSPGVGLVDGAAMRRQLEELYQRRRAADPAPAAAKLLEDVRDYAGLLVERGPGQYGFIHLTFQEYLAALGVALLGQQSVAPVVERLLEHAGEDTWREVILLTVGVLGVVQRREEAASAVVDGLVRHGSADAGHTTILAGEAVADVLPGGVTEACRSDVVQRLLTAMRSTSAVAARARASAGNVLARLGDPRFRAGAWFLPDEPLLGFVEIPGGVFPMGSDPRRDDLAYDDEFPRHEVSLPTYYIARCPVTVAQFQAFVADTKRPDSRAGRAGLANHPVVGVTWHDAVEYGRWLTGRLREWSDTPGDVARLLREGTAGGVPWVVTLPSEAEWEKAARGVTERRFPWGDASDPERANYFDTRILATSPVGSFPLGASPFGVEEMSGNVWEWTRSIWTSYPYIVGDGRERQKNAEQERRVLRGGAFSYVARGVRCAVRHGGHPVGRDDGIGFRVAVSPFEL